MNSDSWLAKFKERREKKRIEKLKREFAFVTDMINSEHNRVINEMQHHEIELIKAKTVELEDKITCSLNMLVTHVEENTDRIITYLSEIKNVQYEDSNELRNILTEIIDKMDDTISAVTSFSDKITSIVNEKMTSVQDGIGETQVKCVSASNEVKNLLQSISCQIDSIHKDTQESIELGNAKLVDQANGIVLSVDEIKTLMKIIAINNLVDEI